MMMIVFLFIPLHSLASAARLGSCTEKIASDTSFVASSCWIFFWIISFLRSQHYLLEGRCLDLLRSPTRGAETQNPSCEDGCPASTLCRLYM